MGETFEDVKVGDKLMLCYNGFRSRYEPVTVTKVSKTMFHVINHSKRFSKRDGWAIGEGGVWSNRDYVMRITPDLEEKYSIQVKYEKLLALFDKSRRNVALSL